MSNSRWLNEPFITAARKSAYHDDKGYTRASCIDRDRERAAGIFSNTRDQPRGKPVCYAGQGNLDYNEFEMTLAGLV
jgi:hypothetical protein